MHGQHGNQARKGSTMERDNQANAMLNGWFSAPQKAWENWMDVMAGSTQNGHAPTQTSPTVDFWNSMLAQWRTYMQQSLDAYSPTLNETAHSAMEQLLRNQGHAQHLMHLYSDAWQSMMASGGSPADWQQALNTYMGQLRQQFANADEATKFLQNSTELWQLYMAEMQKFSQPWLSLWQQIPQQMGMVATGRIGGTAKVADNPLMAMSNLYWDAYNQTLGRMVNMPSLGLMREFNETLNRSYVAWQENQRINFDYQSLLGEALLDSFETFMQKLLEMAKAGESVESQTQLLELWVEVADEHFLELFHSERYATTQSQYVNSSMILRQQQRKILETMLRMYDLPTQSALDEAHHDIFLLRKEVKALKKTVNELSSQVAATVTQAEVKPKSQTTKKTAGAAKTSRARSTRKKSTTAAQKPNVEKGA